ncbi:DUF1648 domain-containing protein [Saccharomonospora iraqiensis]|uniref:DUF1648 domain-containing protein n=1 Tax=Saccharomonospora iraqiensis TaxID=52698 RepID=UPI00022E4CE5|nr:DUF1648 domain-containing protein [Saccharomonospora iraqiensis]
MRSATLRLVLATGGVPAVVLAIAAALRAAWSSRLPDVVAMHWGVSGAPDGSARLTTLSTWCLALGGALTVLGTVVAVVLLHHGRGSHRGHVALWVLLASMPSTALLTSLVTTLDAPDWRQASGAGVALGVLLGGSVAAGGLAALLAPGVPPDRILDAAPGAQTVGLRDGQRATWIGSSTNVALATLSALTPPVVVVLIGLVTGSSPGWAVTVVPTAIGVLAGLGVARVRAIVNTDAVTVRMGFLGMPHRTVPLAEIASATTEDLTLFGTGGLGVRTTVAGDTAYKCRGGPALVLTLRSARRVLVTVDHPEEAAGLVNDLVRRAEPAQD